MRQHPVQLFFRDSKSFPVRTVHDQDDKLYTRDIKVHNLLWKHNQRWRSQLSGKKCGHNEQRFVLEKKWCCMSLPASTQTWEWVCVCVLHKVQWSGTASSSSPHHLDLSHTNGFGWTAAMSFHLVLFVWWSTLTSGFGACTHQLGFRRTRFPAFIDVMVHTDALAYSS